MEELKKIRVRPRCVKTHSHKKISSIEAVKEGVRDENGRFYALTINVTALTKQFYALIALGAVIKPEWGRHSHDKWLEDYLAYKENFCKKFASMLYDYISLIVLGELRHANRCSNWGFNTLDNFSDMSRNQVFSIYRKYTKDSVLKVGTRQFNEFINPWKDQYGGSAWASVARGGLKYGKYPDDVFIDHCFDLEHNNGCIFNKEGYLLYFPESIEELLTKKRYNKNPIELLRWGQTKAIQDLIERGCNIGIISAETYSIFDEEYVLRFDIPEQVVHRTYVFNSSIYTNQFYKDDDRLMKGYDKYDLDDYLNMYHPFQWGTEDFRKVPLFKTGKYYESGCNMNRYRDNRRRNNAINY